MADYRKCVSQVKGVPSGSTDRISTAFILIDHCSRRYLVPVVTASPLTVILICSPRVSLNPIDACDLEDAQLKCCFIESDISYHVSPVLENSAFKARGHFEKTTVAATTSTTNEDFCQTVPYSSDQYNVPLTLVGTYHTVCAVTCYDSENSASDTTSSSHPRIQVSYLPRSTVQYVFALTSPYIRAPKKHTTMYVRTYYLRDSN